MNNQNSLGGVIANTFGAISEAMGAVHTLMSVVNDGVGHGHTLNAIADRNLKNWNKISELENKVKLMTEMSELRRQSAELGIDISELEN